MGHSLERMSIKVPIRTVPPRNCSPITMASVVAGAGNCAVVPDVASESGLAGRGVLIRCS